MWLFFFFLTFPLSPQINAAAAPSNVCPGLSQHTGFADFYDSCGDVTTIVR